LQRGEDLSMLSNIVGPSYFKTLRVPVIAGREFEDRDDRSAAPTALVNRTLAERFWGTAEAAIGKRIQIGNGDWRTVIGVAADLKYVRINEAPRPYIYLPLLQVYAPAIALHARGTVPVDVLADQARQWISNIDAELPVAKATSLTDATRGAFLFYNFMSAMLFIFGIAGLALAALGTYGLVSYTVSQSTHEIGIRMALGATGFSVVRGFLARGLRLGVIGAVVGIAAALGATQLLSSVLFGVSATDGVSFLRALVVVISGVLLATAIPAWRASRTDPLKALRHQ
nr:ABC transporter permease [Acidobacteriota bacterium]